MVFILDPEPVRVTTESSSSVTIFGEDALASSTCNGDLVGFAATSVSCSGPGDRCACCSPEGVTPGPCADYDPNTYMYWIP